MLDAVMTAAFSHLAGFHYHEDGMAEIARAAHRMNAVNWAGMGSEESARMTQLLRGLKGQYGILLVEHDMDAVFALADRISVLVYGKIVFSGTPDQVRNHPDVKAAYLGDSHVAA